MIQFKVATLEEGRDRISELLVSESKDGDKAELILPDGRRFTYIFDVDESKWADVQSLHATIHALRKELAAKDLFVTDLKYNIKEKEKFIDSLLTELRRSREKENHGTD